MLKSHDRERRNARLAAAQSKRIYADIEQDRKKEGDRDYHRDRAKILDFYKTGEQQKELREAQAGAKAKDGLLSRLTGAYGRLSDKVEALQRNLENARQREREALRGVDIDHGYATPSPAPQPQPENKPVLALKPEREAAPPAMPDKAGKAENEPDAPRSFKDDIAQWNRESSAAPPPEPQPGPRSFEGDMAKWKEQAANDPGKDAGAAPERGADRGRDFDMER